MDLRSFGRALRRFWWMVVLSVVVCTGVAAWLTSRIAPTYASHVTFFASTPGGSDTNALQAQQVAQLQVNSFVKLLTSDGLAKRIVGQPGVGALDASTIESEISPSSPVNTVLLTASVVDTSRARGLAIVTAIAREFPPMVASLAQNPKDKTSLHVVSGPVESSAPVGPHKTLNYGLGVLVGLALGFGAAFLRMLLDTSIRTSEQIDDAAEIPTIGSIGYEKSAKRNPIIVEDQVHSVRAEAYRQLRTNLQFADVDRPIGAIVVSSSVAQEGKSTTAANLAVVFAEAGQRVLLIEADLRRPRVSSYLGLEGVVGLTNVLAGQVSLDDVLQRWGSSGLTVLPSGSIPPNPSELLGSQNMKELMVQLRERFEMIILDTPPLLPVTDAAVTSSLADGVVIIARYGKTNRAQLGHAVNALRAVDARVLGAVLNMRKAAIKRRYDGYGYYENTPSQPELPLPGLGGGPAQSDGGPARGRAGTSEGKQPAKR